MKIRSLALLTILSGLVLVAAAACNGKKSGGGGNGQTFQGHARFVAGPSTVAAFAPGASFVGTDGRWYLSPDQAKVTISRISLVGTGMNVQAANLVNCTPTYSRADASGTQLLDCPFTLPGGTYLGVSINLETASEILFDDAANGIYSDPAAATRIASTPPAGGAQFVPFTPIGPGGTTGPFSLGAFLDQPFVFGTGGNGASTDVFLALDLVHTVFGNVSGGTMTLDESLPIPPAFVIPGIGSAPKQQFYTSTGTANNVPAPCPVGCPSNDENQSVRISYSAGATQPYELFGPDFGQVEPVDPATSPIYPDGCKRGGYLGFDGTRLCWAMPADCLFTSYVQLCEMTLGSSLGATSSVQCQHMTTVPAPSSGATYASGCPTIAPDTTATFTLVAH